jgi:multiple sugar transport system substrate-binding protein
MVQGDEDLWMANTRKFTELSGVEVRVDSENFEEVRPKAAVAANVGAGPDIIIATNDDHFPAGLPGDLETVPGAQGAQQAAGSGARACERRRKWLDPLGVVGVRGQAGR